MEEASLISFMTSPYNMGEQKKLVYLREEKKEKETTT
jgi:hypothetical protein